MTKLTNKEIYELDAKRTQGDWAVQTFQSGTVLVQMRDWVGFTNGKSVKGCMAAYINAINVCNKNLDAQFQAERLDNAQFIAAAPQMVQRIREQQRLLEKTLSILEDCIPVIKEFDAHPLTASEVKLRDLAYLLNRVLRYENEST